MGNKLIKELNLQLETDINSLNTLLSNFETNIAPLLPKNIGWQCETVLAEAFTNVVIHAHRNLPLSTPIDIQVKLFRDRLEMCIWDHGEPFDLQAHLAAEKKFNHQFWQKEEGRGLQLIENFTDYLNYKAKNKRNCLIMGKKIAKIRA